MYITYYRDSMILDEIQLLKTKLSVGFGKTSLVAQILEVYLLHLKAKIHYFFH